MFHQDHLSQFHTERWTGTKTSLFNISVELWIKKQEFLLPIVVSKMFHQDSTVTSANSISNDGQEQELRCFTIQLNCKTKSKSFCSTRCFKEVSPRSNSHLSQFDIEQWTGTRTSLFHSSFEFWNKKQELLFYSLFKRCFTKSQLHIRSFRKLNEDINCN